MADAKKPLPQDMVDQDKKKGYETDPFVKLRKKIFGETKATEDMPEMKKGGKVKRYNEGGDISIPEEGTGLKEESFADAFKRNRASGESTFEYKGKKYTTERADDKKAAPAQKSTSTSASMRMKDTPLYKKTMTYKSGGSVSSASKRADGCCVKGKTKGKYL